MRKYLITIWTFSTVLTIHAASGQTTYGQTAPLFQEITLDSAKGDAPSQLAAAAQEAKKEGLTPVVFYWSPRIPENQIVDDILHQASMEDAMKHMYLINANSDVWQKSFKQLGADTPEGFGIRFFTIDQAGRLSGAPWRPQDMPDSLKNLDRPKWVPIAVGEYFKKARALFAQPVTQAKP